MDWIQIVVLALIQGITEFLPISSSAHLVLPAQLTDWPDQGLAFDVGVHFGTLMAVILYFRMQLWDMATDVLTLPQHRRYTEQIDLVCKLALATIPVAIVGVLAKDFIATHLRSILVIACTTTGFGLLLWWADRKPGHAQMVTWSQATIIGLAQVLALIPGTSRSGITITAALLVGLARTSAAHFSFLLAIPTIAGAQLLLTLDLLEAGAAANWQELISGAVIAGIAAYLCINAFITLVERSGMLPYVIYRLVLGAGLFALVALN